jgi:hypothetical protein
VPISGEGVELIPCPSERPQLVFSVMCGGYKLDRRPLATCRKGGGERSEPPRLVPRTLEEQKAVNRVFL